MGDPPRLEEYLERFPRHAEQLRIQFEIHQVLEGISLTSGNFVPGEEEADTAQTGSAPVSLADGTVLPGYEIIGELGRGGMGIVYRARQVALKRLVAVKVILAGAHADDRERASFRTEAEAVARLQHPNIVQIYDIAEHDGLPYFSFEFVDGPSLEKQTGGRPLPALEAAQMVQTLARAMHYAHQQGIIHRDLKPSNILLRASHVPKITDFGVAKLLDGAGRQTATGEFIGTPHYMAPEQAGGSGRQIGPAADVYSLGAILYQLLTGRPPFVGSSVLEVLEQVRSRQPLPPSRVAADLQSAGALTAPVPRDLETICLKCLEKEPRFRYATAYDLAEDLSRFLAGEPIQARPPAWWERTWKWARRRPAAAALAAFSSSAVIGLVSFTLWHSFQVEAARQEGGTRLLEARTRYQEFTQRRDDAVFHGMYPFTDADAVENLKATRRAVRDALAAVHTTVEAETPPAPDPYLSDRENTDIRGGCYQLLLVLAEAISDPLPGQTSEAHRSQVHEALQILQRAAGMAPPTQAYHLRRSRYLLLLGDKAGAKRERSQAVRVKPSVAIDFFLLGDEWRRQGDLAQAVRSFQSALDLQPDDFWSRFFLTFCYLQRGIQNSAYQSDLAGAEANLEKCLEQRPDFPWKYLLRSRLKEKRNDFSGAEADYQKLLALEPNEDARYLAYVNRGQMRFQQGKLDAAAADLEQAVRMKPEPFHAHLRLAWIYQKQRKFAESNQQLAEAIQRRPPQADLAQCHLERGRNFYVTRQYAASVTACDQALEIFPGQVDSHFVRARSLLELKRYAEALQAFEHYRTKGGQTTGDFYRGRGHARLHVRDYVGAIADFTWVMEREPEAEIYRHRGWALYFTDAVRPALADFEEAIGRERKNTDAYIGRGLCRVALGRYREAVVDAEDAWELKPGSPEMMHNIACVFALAVNKVTADPDASNRQDMAMRYRDRAIEALRGALAMLPPKERAAFWRDKVLPDAALDAIRECSDFKKLAGEHAAARPSR
jgi:eukaryotic-like serine/threonine-protein kinase